MHLFRALGVTIAGFFLEQGCDHKATAGAHDPMYFSGAISMMPPGEGDGRGTSKNCLLRSRYSKTELLKIMQGCVLAL